MRLCSFLALALAFCLLTACGGGSAFLPTGSFTGQFLVGDASIGSFTAIAGFHSFGGSGTLIHNAQAVNVAISTTVNGREISGHVENAALGHGSFTGHFQSETYATGTFDYEDAGEISITTGTWTAVLPST